MPATPPLVSVVVPTYGRPSLLRNCVEATLAQRCTFPFELIVIDDGGTPAAQESLNSVLDPRLTVLRVANGGPAKARNEGIRRAQGTYVAFVDDDCIPSVAWLQAAVDAFENDVVMVQGPVAPPQPASPLEYHFIQTGGPANVSANLVVRRAALLAVGGFDEGFPYAAAEDFELCWRLERVGGKRFAPNARVVHVLIPIKWGKRRARPRVSATYFRLYALHPDRLSGVSLPGLRWVRAAVVRVSPPLWIGIYVNVMPLLYCIRNLRGAPWVSAMTELAACGLNLLDSVRFVGRYLQEYRTARIEGGRPGLFTQTRRLVSP
jgi:glycosyltransferase involved in cell wall biosynthesis